MMRGTLTSDAFDKLLGSLDADRERAGAEYERLRRVLIRFFEWRSAPFPDEHADETFDRVSKKIAMGVEIANIGGYCYEVGRLVCLEALKRGNRRALSLESPGVPTPSTPPVDLAAGSDNRLACLDACLSELPEESRRLILEYYRDDRGARIGGRRALADRLGLQRDTLANRAQRVRNKLEDCVIRCMSRQTI